MNDINGYCIAVDGPNGVGKTTFINAVQESLQAKGYRVYVTREPTNTILGKFIREYAEVHSGISLACLVAADRYEHIEKEIIPALEEGKIVISDRYILSSLILQEMDGVSSKFVVNINSEILRPDLQLALFASEEVLQKRLLEREELTRFEKGNQSKKELYFMQQGIIELKKQGIEVVEVYNEKCLEEKVEEVVKRVIVKWKGKKI